MMAGENHGNRPATPEAGDRSATAKKLPRVGLALAGGFARGIAHIGVLRVLREEGIPVDVVAGTSVFLPSSGSRY